MYAALLAIQRVVVDVTFAGTLAADYTQSAHHEQITSYNYDAQEGACNVEKKNQQTIGGLLVEQARSNAYQIKWQFVLISNYWYLSCEKSNWNR